MGAFFMILPKDGNRIAVQLTPSATALATTVSTTISSATPITLNAATTMIRVYATGNDIYMKWGSTSVTNANFDEIIPANQICDFIVPTQANLVTRYATVNFIERIASAQIVVIEK